MKSDCTCDHSASDVIVDQRCPQHGSPKPTGEHPDYRPQDLDDGDTGVARSEENFDPPPKPIDDKIRALPEDK